MNEKRIEQVMQIEGQAEQILDGAKRAAASLPVQAEREAAEQIERTRAEARAAAERMIASASGQDETARILAESDKRIRSSEDIAKANLDRAVRFVLDRVLGKA